MRNFPFIILHLSFIRQFSIDQLLKGILMENGKRRMENRSRGFMAITTVLIISAVVLLIAITVSLTGVNEGQTSFAVDNGEQNLALVEGCAEDYLLKIRANSSFTASNITRPEGTCSITINVGNPNWDITVSSTNSDYQRKVQVKFTRSSSGITLTSWQEI